VLPETFLICLKEGDILKVSDNPPVKSPWVESVADFQQTWFVAHTCSRCEKALAWDLLRRSIGHFLPMASRTRFSGGRRRRVMLPLFPCYLFFNGGADVSYTAMTTNRVCQVINVKKQEQLARELTAIERALQSDSLLQSDTRPARGDRCRVVAGPLKGVEGLVTERKGKSRLFLEVSLISQGAVMEIDADLLEPV
jgi:transcription antitermination factor NusG